MIRHVWVIAAVSLLASGCAMTPAHRTAHKAFSPRVRTSPVFELLAHGTPKLRPRVVVDSAGNGHVIAAAGDPKTVHHIIVGPQGVLDREIIVSPVAESHLDAALDHAGNLHVLVGNRYFVRQEHGWQISEQTPWRAGGVSVKYPRFVPGARDLVWAFLAGGQDVGGAKRWDLHGFLVGGPAAAVPLFWVWPTYGRKLVVAAETDLGPGVWTVLDREEKSDSENCQLAFSAGGLVQVVYDAVFGGSLGDRRPRYVRFRLDDPQSDVPAASANAGGLQAFARLRAVSGSAVKDVRQRGGLPGFGPQTALAADPDTGTLLVFRAHDCSWLVRDGAWSEPIPIPFSAAGPWEPRLTPAGGERFQALLVGKGSHVFYMELSGNTWSAPLDVGTAYTTSFWGWFGEGVEIGSDGRGRALAVWPVKGGIAGRWIDANLPVLKSEPVTNAPAGD